MSDLKSAFEAFASFGSSKVETEMENSKLSKMCKDCGLIDKKFTNTDVDLLFNKIKTKGARKITFAQFKESFVPECATKKGVDVAEIEEKIKSSAPSSSGTKADAVKFHDDKDQYTGVYKAGGPSTIDNVGTDMASHMDRGKQSDARGVVQVDGPKEPVRQKPAPPAKESADPSPHKPKVDEAEKAEKRQSVSSDAGAAKAEKRQSTTSEGEAAKAEPSKDEPEGAPPVKTNSRRGSMTRTPTGDLKSAFEAFASFGSSKVETEMENSKLSKMCKDCGLIDKKFTNTDVDLLFNKIKTKGARKITFAQFRDGFMPEAAIKKGVDVAEIEEKIKSSAPSSSGTKADAVKFHDDKDQYTGVYKAGGPSTIDNVGTDMASHMDRGKKSDARGVV